MAYLFMKAIDNSLFMSFPGGTCLDGVNDFICRCRENYIGKTCGIIMDPCHGITCLNGGRCDITVSFRGECACPSGFTGKRCESSMKVCESMPCGNGGSCVANENKYSCVCLKGYYGDRCEYSSFICTPNSCQNGGICKQNKNRTSCICPSEFVGDKCESSVIELEENFSGAFSPNSCVSFHPHSLFTLFLIFLNLLIPTWNFVSDTMQPVTSMPIMYFIRCSGDVPGNYWSICWTFHSFLNASIIHEFSSPWEGALCKTEILRGKKRCPWSSGMAICHSNQATNLSVILPPKNNGIMEREMRV